MLICLSQHPTFLCACSIYEEPETHPSRMSATAKVGKLFPDGAAVVPHLASKTCLMHDQIAALFNELVRSVAD